jgi:hypothetical protein
MSECVGVNEICALEPQLVELDSKTSYDIWAKNSISDTLSVCHSAPLQDALGTTDGISAYIQPQD